MFLLWLSVSCMQNYDHNISISVNENKNMYKMSAHFNRNKTKSVHEYMDKKLGSYTSMSFVNSEIDATVTLDDKTTFYVKSFPGELEIKLYKDKNSYESYQRIKEMCNGIKEVVKN